MFAAIASYVSRSQSFRWVGYARLLRTASAKVSKHDVVSLDGSVGVVASWTNSRKNVRVAFENRESILAPATLRRLGKAQLGFSVGESVVMSSSYGNPQEMSVTSPIKILSFVGFSPNDGADISEDDVVLRKDTSEVGIVQGWSNSGKNIWVLLAGAGTQLCDPATLASLGQAQAGCRPERFLAAGSWSAAGFLTGKPGKIVGVQRADYKYAVKFEEDLYLCRPDHLQPAEPAIGSHEGDIRVFINGDTMPSKPTLAWLERKASTCSTISIWKAVGTMVDVGKARQKLASLSGISNARVEVCQTRTNSPNAADALLTAIIGRHASPNAANYVLSDDKKWFGEVPHVFSDTPIIWQQFKELSREPFKPLGLEWARY